VGALFDVTANGNGPSAPGINQSANGGRVGLAGSSQTGEILQLAITSPALRPRTCVSIPGDGHMEATERPWSAS
jgi:hypothetical protein